MQRILLFLFIVLISFLLLSIKKGWLKKLTKLPPVDIKYCKSNRIKNVVIKKSPVGAGTPTRDTKELLL